jgi:hypothetical protein
MGANQTFANALAAAISKAIDVTLACSCNNLDFSLVRLQTDEARVAPHLPSTSRPACKAD